MSINASHGSYQRAVLDALAACMPKLLTVLNATVK